MTKNDNYDPNVIEPKWPSSAKATAGKQKYDPSTIEPKWQKEWIENKTFQPDMVRAEKPFYNLMMFPYPSAEGMHVGNMYAFTGADIYGRFKRMQGYDVFEPMGLDGFGIHSENYALKLGEHPKKVAVRTEANFYRQLKASGNAFAWDHILETYDPDYYKWTQWLFIQMFKKGLAYQKEAPVNFCPSCKTVLSDEQVIDTKCERCGTIVIIKKLKQWFFKITAYAEKLLANLEKINWPEKVLLGQKNWIGKSEGAEIIFKIEGKDTPLHVFTTRIDTIYGVTAMVIAPDKMGKGDTPFAVEIATEEYKKEVEKYISDNRKQITDNKNDKTGVFTGVYAINPFSGEKVPIWVSNYVVGWYGTGALMVVPAHDKRDFEFAEKYNLQIKPVIKTKQLELPTTDYGVLIDSGEFTGLTSQEAIGEMVKFLDDTEQGKRQIQYKLRDWIISRQRYWGAPIPMIYCNSCARLPARQGWQPVPESDLPVYLPEIKDWKPKGTGKSPLASIDEFVYTACPECGEAARRETDVLDTFLDSAWYFLRYPSTEFGDTPFNKERTKKWLPVTQYTGGAEHTVLHLLYSRFVTMALHDMGYLDFDEPFPNFYAHGLIIKDGAKMSKSKGNVVIPDTYIKKYGVDALRCYLMFLGPFNAGGDFRDSGMHGMWKFLKRVWNLSIKQNSQTSPELKIVLQRTIKRVTEDISKFKYNTSIAFMMEFINVWEKDENSLSKEDLVSFLKLLAPFTPHLTEEIFHNLGYNSSIHREIWPNFDESLLVEKDITIIIQVNGKVRSQLTISKEKSTDREYIIEEALKDERVQKYLKERLQAKKTIFVPGRLVNFVV